VTDTAWVRPSPLYQPQSPGVRHFNIFNICCTAVTICCSPLCLHERDSTPELQQSSKN
jgi:hypothetical protein